MNTNQFEVTMGKKSHESKSSTAARMVRGYMDSLLAGEAPVRVQGFCRTMGVSRSTFYLYFESIEDLDNRFLWLYLEDVRTVGPPFVGYGHLHRYYKELVLVMQRKMSFFEALLADHRLATYRVLYFELVHVQLVEAFHSQAEILDKKLEEALLLFSHGAVESYLQKGLHLFGPALDEMVDRLIEYLWGGAKRAYEVAVGLEPPIVAEMDALLKKRTKSLSSSIL